MTRQYFKTSGNFTENILGVSDFIVVGEGEKSLLNYITLIQRYHKSRAGLNLPYFCSFKELNNLNTLPFPSYRGIDIKSYPRKNSVPILFSRGCIRKCRFCSERLLYKKFRARPVENVIEEIRRQTIINKIEYFIFHDSLINGDLGKLEKLCDSIIKNFGSIKWEAQIAVRSDMSASLLKKMKKSGCYNLFIGLESGCARTLKDMNKGFTPKDALRFFKKLNNASLFFGISIITGYPGETEADFIESMDFIIKNKPLIPKIEQVNPFTYYDGTSAGRIAEKDSAKRHGILTDKIKSHGFRYTNAFLGNLIEK